MPKICLITLGCPKNIVEGEYIAGLLAERGYHLTTDLEAADCAVVHTCSFIADARNESTDTVARLIERKKQGRLKQLVVTGCLVQEAGKKAARLFPDVDAFIGTGELHRLPELIGLGGGMRVGAPGGLLEPGSQRLLSSPVPSAYLRIAEGCNRRCSFCIIPHLRGGYRSRDERLILEEARSLAAAGVRELVVIAQDTTFYGRDMKRTFRLASLLRRLARVDGVQWIRLMYAYPDAVTDELMAVVRDEPKICKYLDLPLQHVSRNVLKLMGRPGDVRGVVRKLLHTVPDLALRTTFIVGFPGETEQEFEELRSFVAEGHFEHAGVFEYSPHPRARAHALGQGARPEIKKDRRRRLMLTQASVVRRKNAARIGTLQTVFVEKASQRGEGRQPAPGAGRAAFQAPEVDSLVYFTGKARAGEFATVRITGTRGYDLVGKVER